MRIQINLKPGQKRKRAKSAPLAGLKERLQGAASAVKEPLLVGAVAAWVAVLGYVGWQWTSTGSALTEGGEGLARVQLEHKRFKKFLADKQTQEAARDSLVKQIAVIRAVDGDRYVWGHVLDEVAKALPEYTWLTEVGGKSGPDPAAMSAPLKKGEKRDSGAVPQVVQLSMAGRTIDIQAYTKFLRQLEASPWIQNVTPVSAQTVVERERAVTAFTVTARYRVADSAYIQTTPLTQSVR
ncbi:MAG: PilN domain-containing protein [Gemmatimonadales bacterium]|nr:PilN domain-containing protein [Gemmatimonadales bacterium]